MTPVGVEAADRLAAIHGRAFAHPWDAQAFAELLGQSGVFALLDEAGGLILVRKVLDEAEVLTLAVDPAVRRRGLARALLAASCGLAAQAGVETVWLEVAEDNAPARALYLGAGFVEAARRPGYYRRPDGPAAAAQVLRLQLAAPP